MAHFPPLLPPLTSIKGFSGTEADNVIRTSMDIGPAKVRRRSTAAPIIYKLSHAAYTKAQLMTFLQFYRDDVAHGALPFTMDDPLTETEITCKFLSPPQWAPVSTDLFTVTVDVEVLP